MVTMLESRADEQVVLGSEESLSSDEEQKVLDEAAEEEGQPEASVPGITAELVLHPFNNAVQVLWLCEKLKKELQAEILYVAGSPNGTTIKVSIRTTVPLVDFLTALSEVAEAWEEPRLPEVASYIAPAALLTARDGSGHEPSTVVCVALKPPFHELLNMELAGAVAI